MNKEKINERLVIKKTNRGKGIYSREYLPLSTRICSIEGRKINFSETLELADESYALQVGFDVYIVPAFPFYLFNHSCDPNCGINYNLELITIRPVGEGEELNWDYSTSMLERHWQMKCSCNAKNCRQQVADFDTLPLELQQRYLEMGIVLPYMLEEVWKSKHDCSPH
jgi:uncharacterized protein